MKVVLLEDLNDIAENLAIQVKKSGFDPDVVGYVERAGRLIGVPVAKKLGKPAVSISASRKGSKSKEKFSFILKILPQWVKSFLRNIEIRLGVHKRYSERLVAIHGSLDGYSSILLIDDSIDTGNTIESIIKSLESVNIYRENVRVAAITTASIKYLKPTILPDYFIFQDEIIQCPWSTDSNEFEKFQEIYHGMSYKDE